MRVIWRQMIRCGTPKGRSWNKKKKITWWLCNILNFGKTGFLFVPSGQNKVKISRIRVMPSSIFKWQRDSTSKIRQRSSCWCLKCTTCCSFHELGVSSNLLKNMCWHLANYRWCWSCLDHVIKKKWVCYIWSGRSLNESLGGKTDGFCQHKRFFTVFIGISMTEREKWEYAQNVVIKVCCSAAIITSVSKCCFWTKRGMLDFCTCVKTNFQWKEDKSFWDTSFLLCHVYLMKIELTLLL